MSLKSSKGFQKHTPEKQNVSVVNTKESPVTTNSDQISILHHLADKNISISFQLILVYETSRLLVTWYPFDLIKVTRWLKFGLRVDRVEGTEKFSNS